MMMGVMLILGLLVYKLFVVCSATLFSHSPGFPILTDAEVYRFAFPYQFGVIIFAFLTTNTVTLIFAILNSLLVGYLFQGNYFQLMLFAFIGGLAAIYGIRYYGKQRRTSTLRPGCSSSPRSISSSSSRFALIREKIGGPGAIWPPRP